MRDARSSFRRRGLRPFFGDRASDMGLAMSVHLQSSRVYCHKFFELLDASNVSGKSGVHQQGASVGEKILAPKPHHASFLLQPLLQTVTPVVDRVVIPKLKDASFGDEIWTTGCNKSTNSE